jgi:methylenetetrahydrofolate dehydrogenase (NADP+)/methenyltetrahydrofolate cyclohydrolase
MQISIKKETHMPARIIDGKAFSTQFQQKLAAEVAQLKETTGITPGLAVILVGDDPASQVYVRNKGKAAEACGIHSITEYLPANTTQEYLLKRIHDFNHDNRIHGILVQLPLPATIDADKVIDAIHPDKDVDGFHVINAGKLATGQDSLIPCTPQGCMLLLRDIVTDLAGLHAVVIGRSNIVGKPMAQLLLQAGCTVTICHSRTRNLPEITRQADILVAAVGKPAFVQQSWVKQGAIVIDVGINRVTLPDGKSLLMGDVDFPAVSEVASAITPVPGGVGPMTIACLLANTLKAARTMAYTH